MAVLYLHIKLSMKLTHLNQQVMELFQEKLYRLARLQPILDEYKAEQLIQNIQTHLQSPSQLWKILPQRCFEPVETPYKQEAEAMKKQKIEERDSYIQDEEPKNEGKKEEVSINKQEEEDEYEDDLAYFQKREVQVLQRIPTLPWKKPQAPKIAERMQQFISAKSKSLRNKQKQHEKQKLRVPLDIKSEYQQDDIESSDSQWQYVERVKQLVKQKSAVHISGQYVESMTKYNRKKGQTSMKFSYWILKQPQSIQEYLLTDVEVNLKQHSSNQLLRVIQESQ